MADEYISREAAIEEIDKWLDAVGTALVGKGLSYYGELIGCIEDTPAADVAEVVRCKDCKYVIFTEHRDYIRCTKHCAFSFRPNDFCSYGERMEGGDDNVSD